MWLQICHVSGIDCGTLSFFRTECARPLKISRDVTSHHISGKGIQKSGKSPLQYTSGQSAHSSLTLFLTHQTYVLCAHMSTRCHQFPTICKFSADFVIQVFDFLRELLETLSECSTCPGLGISKKGLAARLNCPTCLPAVGLFMNCYGVKAASKPDVPTKTIYLDNIRKVLQKLIISVCFSKLQSKQVSARMDRPAQVYTHPRPDSFKCVTDSHTPAWITYTHTVSPTLLCFAFQSTRR